jgi:hypothetical protein
MAVRLQKRRATELLYTTCIEFREGRWLIAARATECSTPVMKDDKKETRSPPS